MLADPFQPEEPRKPIRYAPAPPLGRRTALLLIAIFVAIILVVAGILFLALR
jgi:hypothetical protein